MCHGLREMDPPDDNEPYIALNWIQSVTVLWQTACAYLGSALRDELRKLTEVAKNFEKDTLRELKVIQVIDFADIIWHQSNGNIQLPISD